jgi:hypothetical protein
LAVAALGCGSTGQARIELPLYARGVAAEPFEVGSFTIQLTEARVGIGPIYLCASARSSSDSCPSAVAEFISSSTVDALDPSRKALGKLAALSANVQSIGLDYGITWPTSVAHAVTLHGAPSGHSATFKGRAESANRSFDFQVDLDLAPALRGTRAVQGLTTHAELAPNLRCELALDPIAWWSQVDFEALSATAGDVIDIPEESPVRETLRTAMTSNATPTFTWSRAP